MGVWFYCLNLLGWLRIDPLEEEVGMDISRHKGSAYDISPSPEAAVDALNLSRSGHKKVTNQGEEATNTHPVAEESNDSNGDKEHKV